MQDARQFMADLFLNVSPPERHVYHHFTCATDTESLKVVLRSKCGPLKVAPFEVKFSKSGLASDHGAVLPSLFPFLQVFKKPSFSRTSKQQASCKLLVLRSYLTDYLLSFVLPFVFVLCCIQVQSS